jgi:hypothetical protein
MAEYNGWSNYETWNVALWMDNEAGSYDHWRSVAQELYDEAEATKNFTREEVATLDLSNQLKTEHEEAQPDLGASVWADLLGAAMSEVNWYEIAEHYISDVDKETEEAEETEETES